jgi:hypothetical protein
MYDENDNENKDIEKYSKIFDPKNISTYKNVDLIIDKNYINQTFDTFKLKSGNDINIFNSKQILYHHKYCPYYKEIKKQMKIKYKNIFDKTIKIFSDKYLKEFRNYINNSFFIFEDIDHLKKVCDSFVQAYLFNDTWFNNNKFSNLYSIYEDCIIAFNVSMYYTEFTDDYFSVPISNYFLHYFYYNLKKAKNKEYDYKKYILFSGHDSTIAAIQQALKYIFKDEIKEILYPYLSSSLIFELIEDKDNNKFYINYKLDDINIFKMEYNKFLQTFEKFIMNDEELNKFCYGNKNNKYYIFYIGICFICLFLIFIFIIIFRKNKNVEKNNSTEMEDKFIEQK